MLGAASVGKSSLCAQFLTSEHINAYDKVGEKTVFLVNFVQINCIYLANTVVYMDEIYCKVSSCHSHRPGLFLFNIFIIGNVFSCILLKSQLNFD